MERRAALVLRMVLGGLAALVVVIAIRLGAEWWQAVGAGLLVLFVMLAAVLLLRRWLFSRSR